MNKILIYGGLFAAVLTGCLVLNRIQTPDPTLGGVPSIVDLPDRAVVAVPSFAIGNETVEALLDTPTVLLSRWGGDETLVINRGGNYLPYVALENSRQWERTDKDETVILEPVPGGVKVDILLETAPQENVFDFEITGADNLEFYYQPPLTAEEIAAGDTRPDNVVGSYAVYHKTLRNQVIGEKNYSTGKAFHIFRPKVYEVENPDMWTWGELSYASGTLSVTVPQEFLDIATYPVRVDPTFGYTTVGQSGTSNYTEDTMRAVSPYTPSSSGYVHGVVAYVEETNGAGAEFYLRAVVYEKDDSLVTYGDEYAYDGSMDWRYYHVDTAAVSNTTEYNIGLWLPLPRIALRYDDSAGYYLLRDEETYASTSAPSSTWVTSATSTDRQYSIYAVSSADNVDLYQEIYGTPGYHLFTVPANVSSIDVECWGAGGAGYDNTNAGGGGGGGGAYAASTLSVSASQEYTIYVGAGGTPGNNGEDSTFGTTTVVAAGGDTATSITGALGGTTGDSTGDTEYNGGDGGDGNNSGAQDQSAGGGAAGCESGDGGNGTNGQVGAGGDGGDTACGAQGGTGAVNNGTPGESSVYGGAGGGGADNGYAGAIGGKPGGGGGGGETGQGNGGDGQCKVTYEVSGEAPATPTEVHDVFIFSML